MDRWIVDSEPSVRYPTYTRANAGEVIPDPMTPLTVTLGIMTAGEAGWRDAYVSTGTLDADEFEDDRPNTIACFGGYLYLNMSLTRIYGVRTPGMTPEMVDFQYFGTMPGIPPYAEEARPTDESPVHTARLDEFLKTYTFARDDLPELRADRDEVDAFIAARPDLTAVADADLVARIRETTPIYRRLFERHITVSASSGVGIGTVAGICDAVGRVDLAMTLVGAAGDVDSAAPCWALWDLSRMVAGSHDLMTAFDDGVKGLPARLQASTSADAAQFLSSFGDFLCRFESRGPNEWELRSAVWGTKPELALAAVDRMRLAGPEATPEANARRLAAAREEATNEVRSLVAADAEAAARFEAGMRAALLFSAARERTKTNNIKIVHEGRLAMRELGRRMVEGGQLGAAEQVFMLRDDELDAFLADPSAFTATLEQREADYLSLFDLEPPFVLNGAPPPVSQWARRGSTSTEKAVPGTVLTGIPGCAGVGVGRARVILDPADPTALEPGDVLVAPVTDPAWTPLFVPAAAVVVDVGAQITHAVIVSRELGIPCVVSVTGATSSIPDGAMVRVDGAAGTVTLV